MPDLHETLGDAEERALRELVKSLRDHSQLAEIAFNTAGLVAMSMPEGSGQNPIQSLKVAAALLVRLSNDLRCVNLLALRGYPLQAAALVSSMYEVAFTIAAIGRDDGLAQEWIDFDDPTRPFRPIRPLTRDGLSKLGVTNVEQQAAVEYRVYRQLCLAKHANPWFQQSFAIKSEGGQVLLVSGPDTGEPAIRAAWFALEHAVGLTFIALASIAMNHLSESTRARVLPEINTVGAERKRLESLAKAKWGTEDPFPGKW